MTDTTREPAVARVAADILHVRRVFGEPITVGDTTLVPVALVSGASGFGSGEGSIGGQGPGTDRARAGSGEGGSFAVHVRPLGAYVVTGAEVRWEPAMDLVKIILGGQAVGAIALVVIARAIRRRRRR